MEKPSLRRPVLRSLFLVLFGMVMGAGLTLGVLFLHPFENPAARLAGTWTGTAEVAGTEVNLTLNLKNQGQTLVGHLDASPGGGADFDSVTIDSLGNFSCTVHVATEEVTFTGKVGADERSMTGKLTTTSYGNGTWSLAKAS